MLSWSLTAGNLVLLLGVGGFILTNRSASQTVRASTLTSALGTARNATNPLDSLSSSQIALAAAQMAHLRELTLIRNQADSDSLILSIAPSDSTALAKPQIVATAQKSKQDITHYVAQSGDTIDSLSTKYGVTADSIRWSNSLSGNVVTAGNKLEIPPVNGIVYTVKAGDTPASIANKYSADEGQIIALNDAEINGLKAGDEIIIPNGRIAPVVTYGAYVANYNAPNIGSFAASYGDNGYAFGYCTWYVANRVSVPNNWGNANTWDNYAAITPGWIVSRTPIAGAIGQSNTLSSLGHVAYVEEVSPDGSMIKFSDMNNLAGWGRVGFSDWKPSSYFSNYIYRQQ